MNHSEELHPVEAFLLAAWVVLWAVRELLIHAAALALLLTMSGLASAAQPPAAATPSPQPSPDAAPDAAPGSRPAPAAFTQSNEPESPGWVMTPRPVPALEALPVRELRRLARELGLPPCLTRSGRRADLLLALPMAW